MDDRRLERIEKKIDDLTDHLSNIDTTLALQHESLKHHIKRTNLLEKKIEPIESHVKLLQGLFKIVSAISVMTGAILGVLKLVKMI